MGLLQDLSFFEKTDGDRVLLGNGIGQTGISEFSFVWAKSGVLDRQKGKDQ